PTKRRGHPERQRGTWLGGREPECRSFRPASSLPLGKKWSTGFSRSFRLCPGPSPAEAGAPRRCSVVRYRSFCEWLVTHSFRVSHLTDKGLDPKTNGSPPIRLWPRA